MTRAFLAMWVGALVLAPSGKADFVITYTSSGTNTGTGNPEAAQAVFDLNGNTLKVTLTNTAGPYNHKYQIGDELLGLFFGRSFFNLTPGTAVAAKTVNKSGTVICAGNCDVSPGWAYGSTLHGATRNEIAAAGFDLGPSGNFTPGPGSKLAGGDYGIVPAGYPGNKGTNLNKNPLEVNSVIFTLMYKSGAPTSPAALKAALGDVRFQYGTSFGEFSDGGTPNVVSTIPEPASIVLLSVVVLLACVALRRNSKEGEPSPHTLSTGSRKEQLR